MAGTKLPIFEEKLSSLSAVTKPKRVELMVRCTDLADLDYISKSDPMCVIFTKQFGQWRELARTEAILDQLNPKFTETMILDYDPEISKNLLFSVYDIDSSSTDLKKHDHVGSVEVNLLALLEPCLTISTTSHCLRYPGDPKSRGYIHITAEIIKDTRDTILMHVGARKLDRKGLWNLQKTDTFLELCRSIGSNTEFHPIYRTELVFKSRDPRWRPFELSVQKLCNGDLDRPIQASCWHKPNGNNSMELIGSAVTTVQELKRFRGKGYMTIPLIHAKKALKKKYKHSGELKILQFRFHTQYTLLDYIRGLCNLRLAMAIDFTSSNGFPSESYSLHSLDSLSDNQYIEAIKTLGGLLSHFDISKEIVAYGFGARVIIGKSRCHQECFPLSGNPNNVFMKGVKGVIDAYQEIIPKLKFSGPTKLAHLIQEVTSLVSEKGPVTQDNQFYYLLQIITDGVINDIDATIEAIIDAAKCPLSIIIVGIGPAEFTVLEDLFQQDMPVSTLKSPKCVASRCNTHFVSMRKQKYATGVNMTLARETFGLVSSQIVSFLKSNDVIPNPPVLSLADPQQNGWIGENELEDINIPSRHLGHTLSSASFASLSNAANSTSVLDLRTYKSVNDLGLSCPTCGSFIDTTNELVIDNLGQSSKR